MPVVYVDKSRIREGKVDAVKARVAELTEFIRSNEPQIVAYAVYIDRDETMTVIHVHTDSESLAFHMTIAGPLFREFAELVQLSSIDVYGAVDEEVVRRLRDKARLLGGAAVRAHQGHVGFVRSAGGRLPE